MPTTIPHAVRPIPGSGFARRLMHGCVYLLAAVIGLSVGPTLFMVSDRTTALRWANFVLDLVGGR